MPLLPRSLFALVIAPAAHLFPSGATPAAAQALPWPPALLTPADPKSHHFAAPWSKPLPDFQVSIQKSQPIAH